VREVPAPAADGTPAGLHGVNPTAVLRAIKARAARLASGLPPPDDRKIGLVIEGGGMRGVCSAGAAVALEHLGLTQVFDEVYGTSAGVMNASYFVAGQGALGIRIYYENMIRREIVNRLRLWKVLDLDLLFDSAIVVEKPLRLDVILSARPKLFVALMDAVTCASVVIDAQAHGQDLLATLKAATALPVFYNRVVPIEGRPYMDAGLVNPFPLADAISRGCTDVLVLLTRPAGYRYPGPSRVSRWLFDRICARGNARLADVFARCHERDAEARDLAFGRTPAPAGVNIATICTDDEDIVELLTADPKVLHAAAVSSGRNLLRIFGADAEAWTLADPVAATKG
jgi:predicted patatin/cPLA2 family phospholipase